MALMYEKCLFFNLNTFTRQLNKLWEDEFAKLGLSASHGYLLRLVLCEPCLTQKDLAERLGLAASTVTRFIDVLEKKGFLKRATCSDDARAITIQATKKAEALEKDLEKTSNRLTEFLTEKLGEKDLENLVNILREHQRKFDVESK